MPVALGVTAVAPAALHAQAIPDPTAESSETVASTEVGGTSTMDLILLKPGRIGTPLRFGSVVPGSERITLDGRALARGQEYSIDYAAGVVYLKLAPKEGQALNVSYRYDKTKTATAQPTSFSGLAPFRFNVAPGSLGLFMGMGMTERNQNGTVSTSNLYGVNNSFSFAGSSLKGLYMVGNKEQVDAESQYEYQGENKDTESGESSAILQALQGKFLGGTIEANFQDISSNFNGFSAFRDNGYQESAVEQLTKERGLKRLSLGFNGVTDLGLSFNTRSVKDGDEGIEWKSYGLNTGALSFNYKSQEVDQNFKRFKDLGEADRQQLQNEAGLKRESMDGAWKAGFGTLSFTNSQVSDKDNNGIQRQEVKLDSSKFKFTYGTQEIDRSFTRFNSLFEQEKGQWGREAGLSRMWASAEASLFSGGSPLKFTTGRVNGQDGSFTAVDASVGGKGWSLEHSNRSVDSEFKSLPNLTQGELDESVNAISRMYTKGGLPFRGEERHWLLQSAGIDRSMTRFNAEPLKDWNLTVESLNLQGREDGASVQNFALDNKNVHLSYRRQNLGNNFTELTNLLELERNRLGTLVGLDRTDLNVSMNLRGDGKLDYKQMNAQAPQGGASRESLSYADKTMDLRINRRAVDADFESVAQMLDPERDALTNFKGFEQMDAQIKWQILPGLRIEAMGMQAKNSFLEQDRKASNYYLNWSPSNSTNFQYQKSEQESSDPTSLLHAQNIERMSLTQSIGRYGKLHLAQTQWDYAGSQSQQPDSVQHVVSYETKLNEKTSVKTEQIRTDYEDGNQEKIRAHTIATELTNKIGVNVTDVAIDRTGSERDEKKTSFGGWIALGSGVRFNLGLAQQGNNLGSDTSNTQMSITPGTLGNLKVENASYLENTWEQGDRTQAMGNFGLSTVKPFDLGFFEDVTLSMSQEMATDHSKWLKENRRFAVGTKLWNYGLGYEYRSQMDNQEQRAYDRTFTLTSSPDDKGWLKGSFFYKLRTMPDQKVIAIRNWTVTATPISGFSIQHQLTTNPEQPRGDVLLGSVPQPGRTSKWKLDWNANPDFKLTGSWDEMRNDSNDALSRLSGITLTLFEKQGSPLSIFFGQEEMSGNVPDRLVDRYSLRYTQKSGPNQAFSLYVGNVTYGYLVPVNERKHNFSAQLEYQLRF
jgi:hypothetical protein